MITEFKYRDFQKLKKEDLQKYNALKLVGKDEIIGYFISEVEYNRLNEPKEFVGNYIEDLSAKHKCELCRTERENIYIVWEDGEERKICDICIYSKYGKNAPNMIKKLIKL